MFVWLILRIALSIDTTRTATHTPDRHPDERTDTQGLRLIREVHHLWNTTLTHTHTHTHTHTERKVASDMNDKIKSGGSGQRDGWMACVRNREGEPPCVKRDKTHT
mmetsp:Transcript_20971/g.51126  ORF Transcript_20971/g.51126 Transcript_20971/m.51126 type:complete len:106 (-) Transcript_20971:364-681(-)